jgi:hypothetical protein
MRERLPKAPEEALFFLDRSFRDTGFFAREWLGMDTDRDGNGNATSDVGKGGIRDWGPHAELVRFIDDDDITHGLIGAPRYSYKSSLVEAFIARKILQRPNISILLVMADVKEAAKRSRQIRDMLQNNPLVKQVFGDIEGPVWRDDQWVTCLRTDLTIQSPTLWVGSPQKAVTGGRPNIIIFDDIVTDVNYRTEGGLKRGRECVERLLSLGSRGERYIYIGTPYHPADAYHWCLDAGWQRLIHLDVGFEVIERPDPKEPSKLILDLEGEPRWPHLTKEFLTTKLRGGMTYPVFMSQFMLKCVTSMVQAFKREQFQPLAWRGEMRNLTGFLLTDVAPSGMATGDMNVLLYVGLDERNRIHILDAEIGYFQMYEFCRRYLDMLDRWQAKVNHRAEMWENGLMYASYQEHIRVQGKERQIRLNPITAPRNKASSSKDVRIAGLQVRFQADEVFVVDTVPKTWNAGTEVRLLWDATAVREGRDQTPLPGGELVEQFVRWPNHAKKDIPDTLALMDTIDKSTQARVCSYVRPHRNEVAPSQIRQSTQPNLRGSSERFYGKFARR